MTSWKPKNSPCVEIIRSVNWFSFIKATLLFFVNFVSFLFFRLELPTKLNLLKLHLDSISSIVYPVERKGCLIEQGKSFPRRGLFQLPILPLSVCLLDSVWQKPLILQENHASSQPQHYNSLPRFGAQYSHCENFRLYIPVQLPK
jgi:hypothetical protein